MQRGPSAGEAEHDDARIRPVRLEQLTQYPPRFAAILEHVFGPAFRSFRGTAHRVLTPQYFV